eukprot:TRINITY_DN3282_c0_g1_i1.p1 TRINITY_DN3282_c0_g1~~TRINITY_DN3282_c0_g1_i1.p1  ORF type:complete len:1146 (+),score=226.51 TRINITY_DN3282_c0_g1_i1:197-3439(+)
MPSKALLRTNSGASLGTASGAAATASSKKDKERIALLEYELKLAREDCDLMKEKLEAQKTAGPLLPLPDPANAISAGPPDMDAAISAEERRLLLYLLKQFLVVSNHKNTLIALLSEVGDPDDIAGLRLRIPRSLLQILRLYLKNPVDARTAPAREESQSLMLEKKIVALQQQVETLQAQLRTRTAGGLQPLPHGSAAVAELTESTEGLATPVPPSQQVEGLAHQGTPTAVALTSLVSSAGPPPKVPTPAAQPLPSPNPPSVQTKRSVRSLFNPAVLQALSGLRSTARVPAVEVPDTPEAQAQEALLLRIEKLVDDAKTPQEGGLSLVHVAADTLPFVVPNVLIAKREELIPLFVAIIAQHPDIKIRDSLTNGLFNLVKKPDVTQRKMIMDGCVALAKVIGEERTAEELLPQCWEQIEHKSAERRTLVAMSCGALAQFVRADMRASLILSIILQLVDDKSPLVRQAVAENAGLLLSHFPDADKFRQIHEMFYQLLFDDDESVSRTTLVSFAPRLSDWALSTSMLAPSLLASLLSEVKKITDRTSLSPGDIHRLELLGAFFSELAPRLRLDVVFSAPFAQQPIERFLESIGSRSVSYTDSPLDRELTQLYHASFSEVHKQQHDAKWPSLDWLTEVFLPSLIDISSSVDVIGAGARAAIPIASIFRRLCQELGCDFTEEIPSTALAHEIADLLPRATSSFFAKEESESAALSRPTLDQNSVIRARLLYFQTLGVKAALPPATLIQHMRSLAIHIALGEEGLSLSFQPLLATIVRHAAAESPAQCDRIIELFGRDLSTHTHPAVRALSLGMLQTTISAVDVAHLRDRFVPCFSALGTDADERVRIAALNALASILGNCTDDTLLDIVALQLDSFADKSRPSFSPSQLAALGRALLLEMPAVSPSFRDRYVLPRLTALAQDAPSLVSTAERTSLISAVFEAFCTLNGVDLAAELVSAHILPGLKAVNTYADLLDPSNRPLLATMLRTAEGASSGPLQAGSTTTAATAAPPKSWRHTYIPGSAVAPPGPGAPAAAAAQPPAIPSAAAIDPPADHRPGLLQRLKLRGDAGSSAAIASRLGSSATLPQ